jgi:hypothetical protein
MSNVLHILRECRDTRRGVNVLCKLHNTKLWHEKLLRTLWRKRDANTVNKVETTAINCLEWKQQEQKRCLYGNFTPVLLSAILDGTLKNNLKVTHRRHIGDQTELLTTAITTELLRMVPSGLLHRVALVRTDVSEEPSAPSSGWQRSVN